MKIPYFCTIVSFKTQALDSTNKNFLIRIIFHGVKNSSLIPESRNFRKKKLAKTNPNPNVHKAMMVKFLNSYSFLFFLQSNFVISDLSCLPPKVRLQNLPSFNNKGPAVAILRSNDFIVQGNVLNANCNSSNTLLFKWFLTSYSVNEAGETKIKETTLLDVTGSQWNLPKRTLDYGTYYVDFRAAFASNPKMFGSTLGFFTIEKSPLRAKISGGNTVTRGKDSTITLDGSLSQDPDVEPGNITSMKFTWLCKKRNESFPNLSVPIPIVSLTPGPGQGGGCFGTGVGRLSSNRVVVNLSTSAMNVGEFYDIKLIVQKDTRDDDFVQEINIVNGNPPEVTIR